MLDDLSPSIPFVNTSPHERWISENGSIYYRKSSEPSLSQLDPLFFKSVPQKQSIICFILNKANCPVIPYLAGDFLNRSELKASFNMLKKDEMSIRNKGLCITNTITKEKDIFLNPKYRIPWGKFDDYFKRFEDSQNKSSLAFFVPQEKVKEYEKLKNNQYASPFVVMNYEKEAGNYHLFSVITECSNEQISKSEWQLLTQYIGSIFS